MANSVTTSPPVRASGCQRARQITTYRDNTMTEMKTPFRPGGWASQPSEIKGLMDACLSAERKMWHDTSPFLVTSLQYIHLCFLLLLSLVILCKRGVGLGRFPARRRYFLSLVTYPISTLTALCFFYGCFFSFFF